MNIQRNFFIDNLKVILILLVVFGHLIERYINVDTTLKGIYFFIYLFHMPLFVFTSGALSKNLNKKNKNIFKSLIIPYIVFNIILFIFSYLFYPTTNFIPIIYAGWTLWFLLSLFFWRISLKYLIKVPYVIPLSFLCGIMIGFLPIDDILSISRTFYFLPYFLLGYYFDFKYIKYIKKHALFYKLVSFFILLIIFYLSILVSENNWIDYKFLYSSTSYLNLGYSNISGFILRAILYLLSTITSLCICIFIPDKETFYSKIAKMTMYIYTFHIYPVAVIFFLIPIWNKNILTKIIIFLSPLLLTYILSRKFFERVYSSLFSFIDTFYKSIFKRI